MKRPLVKRILMTVGAIGVIGLMGTQFTRPTEKDEEPAAPADVAKTEIEPPSAETPENEEEETAGNSETSSNWFDSYRNDFGADALELEGRVTVNYPGYEGKFRLLTLVPSPSRPQTSVPIFLMDEKNPSVNSLGSGTFERTPQERIRFVGNAIQTFFSRKATAETTTEPAAEPSGIANVIFKFDSSGQRGTSTVEVNFASDPNGLPTPVGKMEYALKAIGSANL